MVDSASLGEALSRTVSMVAGSASPGSIAKGVAAEFECFRTLPEHTLEELLDHTRVTTLPANEFAIRSGEPADSMFVILGGEAFVQLPERELPEAIQLRRGQIFGEGCLSEGSLRSASVVVAGKMRVLECDAEVLRELTRRHHALKDTLWSLLTRRQLDNFARASPLLEGTPHGDRAQLLSYCRVTRLSSGTIVQRRDEAIDYIRIPLTGTLLAKHPCDEPRSIVADKVFGGRAVCGEAFAESVVRACTDMLCLEIPRSECVMLEMRFPNFARNLILHSLAC